jgi:hypothetical protein
VTAVLRLWCCSRQRPVKCALSGCSGRSYTGIVLRFVLPLRGGVRESYWLSRLRRELLLSACGPNA